MHEDWSHIVGGWHELFLLISPRGFTLTGLLFVVVSVGPHIIARNPESGLRAFITPNVFYFSATLIISAVLLVPPLSPLFIGALLCAGSLGALAYFAYTRVHQRWRSNNLPIVDWVFYVSLPVLAFMLLFASGIGFFLGWPLSIHGVALSVILLLVAGIRNAWDLTLWMVQQEKKSENASPDK